MEHLIIGEAQAEPIREYARSWERATSARPWICSWRDLGASGGSGGGGPLAALVARLPPGPLPIRCAAPSEAEAGALMRLGSASAAAAAEKPVASVELAPAAVAGLGRALESLEQKLRSAGSEPRYATPPEALLLLLDRERQQQVLVRDGMPAPRRWPLRTGGAHESYEALRDQLRQRPPARALVRLARSLPPVPAVTVWHGGRGIRAVANCLFTPAGAVRAPVHPIEDETELRPLLGRLFELGAVVEEEWPCAEWEGRPFTLALLAVGRRVVLGEVRPFAWAWRGEPPGPPPPLPVPEFTAVRRQLGRALYDRIEETCVRLAHLHRCAGLVVEVALTRRFDRFAVLDVDPFADLLPERRDAVGWTGADHLVRRLRQLLREEGAASHSSVPA